MYRRVNIFIMCVYVCVCSCTPNSKLYVCSSLGELAHKTRWVLTIAWAHTHTHVCVCVCACVRVCVCVHLGSSWIGGEQPPVDVAAVAEVRVVAVLRGQAEHTLHQSLRVCGPLEEELHYGCQQLQLDLLWEGGKERKERGREGGREGEREGEREGGREGEESRTEGERGRSKRYC